MVMPSAQRGVPSLPAGYVAVAAFGQPAGESPLRVCVLVKKEADSAGGQLVVLRENLDSRVFLGCVQDAGARILEYVEIWIQTAGGLQGTTAMYRQAMNNAALDNRWRRQAESLRELDGAGLVVTGWEDRHPLPSCIDVQKEVVVQAVCRDTGTLWGLCEDDALLTKHGLPPYASTLHRYLCAIGKDAAPVRFIPVTPGAPTNAHTMAPEDIVKGNDRLLPFNIEGGLMLVRPFDPLTLDEYLGLLGGASWQGVPHGRATLDPGGIRESLATVHHPARLFLGAKGMGGRLLETLHLKVCALAEMIRSVSLLSARQQQPLLNLSGESFRVRFADVGSSLPLLWAAQPRLVVPGEAATVLVEASDIRYYLRAGETAASIYRPLSERGPGGGRGEVRIRQVTDTGRGIIVEGTFRAADDIAVNADDLVWLRLNLGQQPVDLHGHFAQDKALARGEWRFRTTEQRFSKPVADLLRRAEGVPIPNAPLEVIPLLGSPCDLYSLAVLGVRMFLANRESRLAVALDEMLSLARESGAPAAEGMDLPAVIAGLFGGDERWSRTLSPNRLIDDPLSAEDAFAYVPAFLWWKTLAMLIRMFPGVSGRSSSQSLGAGSADALSRVFDRAAQDADELQRETRSMIVTDWRHNREICEVLDARIESCERVES